MQHCRSDRLPGQGERSHSRDTCGRGCHPQSKQEHPHHAHRARGGSGEAAGGRGPSAEQNLKLCIRIGGNTGRHETPCTESIAPRQRGTMCRHSGTRRAAVDMVYSVQNARCSNQNSRSVRRRAMREYASLQDHQRSSSKLLPPSCLDGVLEMPSSRRVSVREAFASSGLDVPASYLKNQTRGRDGENRQRK